jgi:hypothetical protein
MAKKNKDSERKRKERAEAASAKGAQIECSSSASVIMQSRVSPRKLPVQKPLIGAAATGTVNWSSSDDVRMIFVACSPEIQKLFELLGHPCNRGELEGSNSATDARPSSAFYGKLAEIFSDSAFKGTVPADWPRDEHLPVTKFYALREARDGAWMKNKWRSLAARHEVAWRRYCGVSGTDGDSCFCGCGKGGFWTTSGFLPHHANKLSSDETADMHGDRKCVAPVPHLGVYVWSVAMANNACMRAKGSIVIPEGVRSEGEVGTARGKVPRKKAGGSVKRGAACVSVGSSDDDGCEQEKKKKKKKTAKPVPYDHRQATFLDDGHASCKSTRASRESSMIAVLAKLAPQEATPLDALFKRRAQLLEEDQTLITNLFLAQKVLAETPAGDTDGVVWAKDKIARIRATSTKADAARDANDAAILEAQEKEEERQQGSDSKGIMQTLRDALCVGQRARNPRTCAGVVVATDRPSWRLQRGCSGELVCNDQVVKSHASLDDDGSPRNRQSNGPLQDPPLVHQHSERTLNCHSQRTMIEGEDAFVGAHVPDVGSQD